MAVDFVRYMAGWATKLEGSTLDLSLREPEGMRFHAYTLRQPSVWSQASHRGTIRT
jgi:hypothetical protein